MSEQKNKLPENFIDQINLTKDLIRSYEGINLDAEAEVKRLTTIEMIKLKDRLVHFNKHLTDVKLVM